MQNPFAGIARALTPQQIQARLETLTTQVALTSGVNTLIDSILADSYQGAVWQVTLVKAGGLRRKVTVWADHDGTSAADATTAGYTEAGADDMGTVDVVLSADVSGVGAAQVMRLMGLASSAGWTAESWRIPEKPAQI